MLISYLLKFVVKANLISKLIWNVTYIGYIMSRRLKRAWYIFLIAQAIHFPSYLTKVNFGLFLSIAFQVVFLWNNLSLLEKISRRVFSLKMQTHKSVRVGATSIVRPTSVNTQLRLESRVLCAASCQLMLFICEVNRTQRIFLFWI